VRVICTAGHVDHGKSSLVRALTGMEPDRLAEEQRRSMTIDIGFAWCSLVPGDTSGRRTVAFVDLPGHHRFIGNMLAGASSVGVALLVVSADDGPMPQTMEHLAILDLLGVEYGLVAVTKTDLVDEATVEIAVDLVREALDGTSLAAAPVVPVSAVTGENLDTVRETLLQIIDGLPAEEDTGRPRLWVDRSFSVRGAGTVVTGTLRQGSLGVGEEVVVLPGGQTARIRGMQSLERQLDRASPGSRVAVNLVGVARQDVSRGAAVVHPGQWLDVRTIEAAVRTLPDRPLMAKGDWHLHCGSGEWKVSLRTVSGRPIPAADEGLVRLELPAPAALAPGDRFVLRELGRQVTVSGGIVLDVAPGAPARGRAGRESRLARLAGRLESLRAGDRMGLVVDHARAHRLVSRADVTGLAGLGRQDQNHAADQRLVWLGGMLAEAENASRWRAAAAAAVGLYHAGHPTERAAPKDIAVRAAVAGGCPPAAGPLLVTNAVDRGELTAEGTGVRLPGHQVRLSEDQALAAEQLLDLLNQGGFAPPELPAALAQAGAQDVMRELEASGRVVRIALDLAMTSEALDRAHELLLAAYLEDGPLTASRARDVLGTTRKYVLPLLAALDQRGCTRRRGDLRVVLDVAHHHHAALKQELAPASP
jgi:selenocysteine-specific elongation factor